VHTWPLAAHVVFWLQLSFGIKLCFSAERRQNLPAWLAGGILGLAILLPLILPLLPQLKRFLSDYGQTFADPHRILDMLSMSLTGRLWDNEGLPAATHPDWASHALGAVPLVLSSVVLALGIFACWRSPHRSLLWFCIGAPCGMVVAAQAMNSVFFIWYMAIFTPSFALLMGLGLASVVTQCGTWLKQPQLWPLWTGLLVCTYFAVNWRARNVLREVPAEPLRQAAQAVSPTDAIIGVRSPHMIYTPTARRVMTGEQLAAAMEDARISGRPLFIVENHAGFDAHLGRDLGKALADPTVFRKVFHGDGFYPDMSVATHEWIGR
jgi:hypothetical protein